MRPKSKFRHVNRTKNPAGLVPPRSFTGRTASRTRWSVRDANSADRDVGRRRRAGLWRAVRLNHAGGDHGAAVPGRIAHFLHILADELVGGFRMPGIAQCSLNQDVSLMLSVVQWRYGSAFSHRRRLPADLDIFSLSPLRPFRLLHMFQIRTSVVGRRPHNTVPREAPWRVLAPNRFACFPEPGFSLGLRIFAVCPLPSSPILLSLTLHRWRFRVLDLDPMR
jgi:hypothetical protein